MKQKLDPRAIYGGREPGQCAVCVTTPKTDPYCQRCGREVPPLADKCGNFIQEPGQNQWVRCVLKKHKKGPHRSPGLTWTSSKGIEWEDEFPEHYKAEEAHESDER
jgi:hypothetical protein